MQLAQQGFRAGILSADIIENLNERFTAQLENGLISPDVHREYMKSFDFNPPSDMPDARSIIVVAVPQPCVEVIFSANGKKLPGIIPPTYSHVNDPEVEKILNDLFTPNGYSISRTNLPLKLMAVHSGLAKYGKNNVTYVDGMGSYHRLIAFWSDLPCPANDWYELQALDECTNCKACLRKCPTKAISPDSFQVRADRCLTYFNELTAEDAGRRE